MQRLHLTGKDILAILGYKTRPCGSHMQSKLIKRSKVVAFRRAHLLTELSHSRWATEVWSLSQHALRCAWYTKHSHAATVHCQTVSTQ